VTAAPIAGGVVQAQPLEETGVIGGHLLLLDRHGELRMAVLGRQTGRPLGQLGAESPDVPRVLDQLHHSLLRAEGQLHPRLLLREGSHLVELHGAGHGGSQADRVDPQLVAEEVRLQDRVQVVDAAVRAEGPGGLILGPLAAPLEGAPALRHPAAADDAAEAALVADHPLRGQALAAHLVGGLEIARLEVLRWQAAHLVEDVHQDVRPVGGQARPGDGGRGHLRPDLLHRRQEALLVGHADALGPPDHQGLQVLGAHDGTHAAPAGGPMLVVHDVGQKGQLLPGGADAGDLGLRIGGSQQKVRGLGHVPAPDPRGVPDLHALVVDVQVDRLLRLPLEDDHVIAGELQLRTEIAPRVGGRDGPRQGGLGDHVKAPRGGGQGPGQRARGEDQLVFLGQGIHLGIDFPDVVVGPQAPAAQIAFRRGHVERFLANRPIRQIDPQNRSDPSVHPISPPPEPWPSSRRRPSSAAGWACPRGHTRWPWWGRRRRTEGLHRTDHT